MKLKITREPFESALAFCGRVIPARTPQESLRNVRLDVDERELKASATNLSSLVSKSVDNVDIACGGSCLVSHELLHGIVKSSGDEAVSLELHGGTLVIRTGSGTFKLPTAGLSTWPEMDAELDTPDSSVITTANHLRTALKFVNDAQEEFEVQGYATTSVLLESTGKKASMVAVNGNCMFITSFPCSGSVVESMLLPPSLRTYLLSELKDDEDECSIERHGNRFAIRVGESVLFVSTLFEGQFPPYKDMVAKKWDGNFTAGVKTLDDAARTMLLLTDEVSRAVNVDFNGSTIRFAAATASIGEGDISVGVESLDGCKPIAANVKLLHDMLRRFDAKQQVKVKLAKTMARFEQGDNVAVLALVNR